MSTGEPVAVIPEDEATLDVQCFRRQDSKHRVRQGSIPFDPTKPSRVLTLRIKISTHNPTLDDQPSS